MEKADADGNRRMRRLETVYRRSVGYVYTLCLRLLANVYAAEQVTVRVFVRLNGELKGWWSDSQTRARLQELTINEALAWLRTESSRQETPERADSVSEKPATSANAAPPTPLDRTALEALIARLPNRLRIAFVLHDIEGLSDTAVAAHLHTDKAEARRLINAARLELRGIWLARTEENERR